MGIIVTFGTNGDVRLASFIGLGARENLTRWNFFQI